MSKRSPEPPEEDPETFLSGYKAKVIAGGNFGCVFEIYPQSLPDAPSLADKLEVATSDGDLESMRKSVNVHSIVSRLPSPPGIVRLHRSFAIRGIPQIFLDAMVEYETSDYARAQQAQALFANQTTLNRCSSLKRDFENFVNRRRRTDPNALEPFSHHSIMELANGGNLWELIATKAIRNEIFLARHIMDVMFSIGYSLSELWDKYGFIHGDVRAKNIVLDTHTRQRNLIYLSSDGSNICSQLANEDAPGFLAKITDFGHASIEEQRTRDDVLTEYHNVYFAKEPPFVFFVDVPLIIANQITVPRKSPHADMWALGLVFLSQLTCGLAANGSHQSPLELYKNANSKSSDIFAALKGMVFHVFYRSYRRYAGGQNKLNLVAYHTHKLMLTIPGICLLNHSLGNGLLPPSGTSHGFEFSPIYWLLERNQNLLIEMGNVRDNATNEVTPVYDNLLAVAIARFGGMHVIEFLRKLFAWDNMQGGFEGWHQFMDDPIFGCYKDLQDELVARDYPITPKGGRKSNNSNKRRGSPIPFSRGERPTRSPKFPDRSYVRDKLPKILRKIKTYGFPEGVTVDDLASVTNSYPLLNSVADEEFFLKRGNPAQNPLDFDRVPAGYSEKIEREICSSCERVRPSQMCPCLTASYCSRRCRKVHWKSHRKRCLYYLRSD